MRWLVIASALMVLIGAAIVWQLSAEPEAPPPVAEPSPPEEVPPPEVVAASGVAPSPSPEDAGPVLAVVSDGGPTLVEVTVEVFGANGHEPGAGVSFHAEPTDRYWHWEAQRDPEKDFGAAVGGGRTNVMGFTTVQLPLGRWRVHPHAEPPYVTIRESTKEIAVHLRTPNVVRGIVIDENGRGVPTAHVEAERNRPGAQTARGLGIPVAVDKEGRFALSTFDSVLTFSARSHAGRDDSAFRKRVNLPSPEVKLYLGRLGEVHFEVLGARAGRIEVEIESFGLVATDVLDGARRISVVPGHVKFRARAAGHKVRLAGAVEVDVKAGEVSEAKLELSPAKGQRIHLVDLDQRPIAAAQLLLKSPPYAASATTDSNGDAWFSPGAQGSAQLEATNLCLQPMPFVSVLDDELTAIVVPCPSPDSGAAIEAD